MFESYDKKSKYSISPLWSDVRLINKVFLMEDKMEALRVPKKKNGSFTNYDWIKCMSYLTFENYVPHNRTF